MSLRNIRLGPSSVSIPLDSSTAVPNCSSLTFTASGTTLDDSLLNDVESALDATATYQVIVALMGRDVTNKGYTISVSSLSSGSLSITAGQGILVSVTNANWPAGFDKAACAAVFLKKNSGNFQLSGLAYVDPSNDFKHMVVSEPLITVPSYTQAQLRTYTTESEGLGDRNPLGYTFSALKPTTGGVTIAREASTVTVAPDDSADYPIATTRSTSVSFQLLANDIKDVVRAWAGNYAKYTSGGVVYDEAQMSLLTAQAVLKGNIPLKVVMPANSSGKQETRLYLASVLQNQTAWSEAWTKSATTPVSFTFSTIGVDSILIDQSVEVIYRRNS